MSHQPYSHRMPALLLKELEGLEWTIEGGRKHLLLRVAGELVGILPRNGGTEAANKNTLSVRSAIRRLKRGVHPS